MTSQELLDEELEKCVNELMQNSHEDYSGVHVHVDAQNAYFSGALASEKARKHLEELARMVQGIGSVTNDVTLKH
jgi:osmotically-inducible protein OsmY